MDIHDMRIFARVAALQNLSAVGVELDLTPGTISKRLQSLEEELSARLFDRTTRSIRITEEGSKFLEYVERILTEIDEARAAVSANVEKPRGNLRISAPSSLGRGVIAPAICMFMQEYPEIRVQIDLTDRVVNLQEDGYDVVIRTGTLIDSTLIAKRLGPDPQVLVASRDFLRQNEPPQVPDDLRKLSCLVLGDSSTWSFRRGNSEQGVRVTGRLRSDNSELLRHAALEGLGILRISSSRVVDDLKTGVFELVLADHEVTTELAIWAVYPSTRHVLPKLKVFLDFLGRWFQQERTSAATISSTTSAKRAKMKKPEQDEKSSLAGTVKV